MVHISNITNTLISIYYAFSFYHILWNKCSGYLFRKWEDFHFTKENHQKYGWYTTQNLLQKSTKTIRFYLFFIINNQENFQTHSSIHNNNTRNKLHLHRPNANLSCFQKSTFYAGIKIFTSLPPSVTTLKNDKAKFKAALRKYHPFNL